jgi:hypothetical protein
MVGAVGIEIASLLHKDLHGNDLVPLSLFQLLLNVVKLNGERKTLLRNRVTASPFRCQLLTLENLIRGHVSFGKRQVRV